MFTQIVKDFLGTLGNIRRAMPNWLKVIVWMILWSFVAGTIICLPCPPFLAIIIGFIKKDWKPVLAIIILLILSAVLAVVGIPIMGMLSGIPIVETIKDFIWLRQNP